MDRKAVLFISVFLIGAVGFAASAAAQAAKVVFLRSDEVVTANEDGTGVKVLTHDGIPKSSPMWSPDGAKIAYVVGRASPKSLGTVVIIAADGKIQNKIQVLTEEANGTVIEGMRFIEQNGWYSNTAVFVSGSANPYIAEYRILDANTGHTVGGYLGYDFAISSSIVQFRDDPTQFAVSVLAGSPDQRTRSNGQP